jgi:hypothetical protein
MNLSHYKYYFKIFFILLCFGIIINLTDENAYERNLSISNIILAILISLLWGLSNAIKFRKNLSRTFIIFGKIFVIIIFAYFSYRSINGWEKIINESRVQYLKGLEASITSKFSRGRSNRSYLKLRDNLGREINILDINHKHQTHENVRINCKIGLLGKLFDGEIIQIQKKSN